MLSYIKDCIKKRIAKSFIDKFVSFFVGFAKQKRWSFTHRARFFSAVSFAAFFMICLLFFTQQTCRVLFHGSWKMKKYWFSPFTLHHLREGVGMAWGEGNEGRLSILSNEINFPAENLLSRSNHARRNFWFDCCNNWWNFMSLGSSTSINIVRSFLQPHSKCDTSRKQVLGIEKFRRKIARRTQQNVNRQEENFLRFLNLGKTSRYCSKIYDRPK